jgi:hypothetical protein
MVFTFGSSFPVRLYQACSAEVSNDDQRPQSQLLFGILRVFSVTEVVLFNCPNACISA